MELTQRKIKNSMKSIEVAIARLEQLYPTEFEMIERLREIRIQLGQSMHEMNILKTIEEKSTGFEEHNP